MTNKKCTNSLIDELCADLQPCKKLRHPCKCTCGWALIAIAYTALAIYILGVRIDLAVKLSDYIFLFETGLMFAIGATAALATAWMRFPDYRGKPWIIAVPYTLFLVFLGWTLLRGFDEGFAMAPLHLDACIIHGILLGLVPAAGIILMTKQGTTICPCLIASMNALAVTGLGYVALRITCAADAVGHTFLYHFLPFIVLGMALGCIARRLFRW